MWDALLFQRCVGLWPTSRSGKGAWIPRFLFWWVVAGSVLWWAISPCGREMYCCAEETGPLTLETPVLKLRFQSSPSPHLAQMIHKASGTSLLAEPPSQNLFQIALVESEGQVTTLESSQAKQTTIHQEFGGESSPNRGPENSRLVLSWSGFPGLDLRVQATVSATPNDPLTRWTLRVENRSGKRVAWIRFPLIMAVPALGDPQDDVLVLPALPGTLIRNPAAGWSVGYSVSLSYPGNLSAQFLSFQDRSAGVYLASMDCHGHPLGFGVGKRREGMLLYHQWEPLASDQQVWESPYPVVLGVVQGSWHRAADQYKLWAAKQPWCAKTLAQREDIPDWWKQGPMVHVCSVRTYDGQGVCNGSYYPKLLDHLRSLREKVDGPIVVMLAGWEKHRCWTGGDCFPIFDEAQALPVLAQVRQEGFRPFFFLSGLFYTFRNEGVDPGEIPEAEQFLPHFVIDKQTGRAQVFLLDESSPKRPWRRFSYQFCVGASATKDFFCGLVDQALARGVDVLQMDQTVAGAGATCYSTGHAHPPGPGLYQTQGFHDLLRQMREHGKSKTKDFVLFHEEPHEQLIPLVDGFHVREYYENRWYRSYRGAVGIPLFSYLYHEYAIGYGGDSAGLSPANDRRLVRTHAVNLVTGRTPGIALWGSHQRIFDAHPDQIRMVRNHCRLLKTPAGSFLMLGKMLHPLELEVPRLTSDYPTENPKAPTRAIEDAAVLTSSWQSPDGRVGHLLVNISETAQRVRVRLDTRNVPGWGLADAALYSSVDSEHVPSSQLAEAFRPLWKAVPLPQEFVRQLAPLEVVFVALSPSAGSENPPSHP